MLQRHLTRFLALATVLGALGSCGGERPRDATGRLDPPASTLADAGHCIDDADGTSLVAWRHDGLHCRRSYRGLTAAVPAVPPAAAPAAQISVTQLFDWAETQFRDLFPSRRSNQVLHPYTYRYYPETGNHVAVAGDQIYVQGPLSGGALLYVGTVAEYACSVVPQACAGVRPCTVPTTWTAAGRSCSANEGQPRQLASGANFTFLDTAGETQGQITYQCQDSVLSTPAATVCEPAPALACNTHELVWSTGSGSCRPNAGEPTQLASGATHRFSASTGNTVGSASYSCDNGLLLPAASPSCAPVSGTACSGQAISWSVDGQTCRADNGAAQVAQGGRVLAFDFSGTPTGSASFVCQAGTLQLEAGATCSTAARLVDSFGGDGGDADGGAAGDGTAADGAPIVGGLVRVVDARGRRTSATTDARGYFRVRLTGMTPPLLVSVTRPDGKVRRSISVRPLRANSYQFIAVTGLTDKIVSDIAAQAGLSGAAAVTPALVERLRDAVDNAVTSMRNNPTVRQRLQAAGIDPASFDPLHAPFRPDGSGYDGVLDRLLIDTDERGVTVVRAAECTTPASWTVDGVTCTPDPGTAGQIDTGASLVLRDSLGSTRGAVGFSCTKGVLSRPLQPSCRVSGP